MAGPRAIAWVWTGRVPARDAERFRAGALAATVARAEAAPGCLGVTLLRHADGASEVFTLTTTWRSAEAARRAFGPTGDGEASRSDDPESDLVSGATQHEVLLDRRPRPQPRLFPVAVRGLA